MANPIFHHADSSPHNHSPNHNKKGIRNLPFDEKSGQFGTDYEVYSLKTGQLCYKHTIYQSLIDVTKGGRAVHPNQLAQIDSKWKQWKEWWNGEAEKSQKLLAEAEVRSNMKY